jgi:DNA-binding transcriptional LysR family regulator
MIEITRLETFLQAAENLSFTEAARQLHLTQPTISHHIKSLEAEFGTDLFIREGTKLRLTEAGRLLIPWARKLLRDSIELKGMMDSLKSDVVGHLRIACSTTAGKYVLPQLAARFCQRFPGVRVSIMRCIPENVVPSLLEGKANLGVVSYEIDKEDMELQEFFEDSISLIVPFDHPWALRKIIHPADITKEKIILREAASGTRRVMLSELAKFDIGLDDLNVFMELGNAEAIVRTVAAGYGVSFVSSLATSCPLERGNIVDVKVEGLQLRRKVYMMRKRLESPYRPQEAFWSYIHAPGNQDLIRLAEQSIHAL